MHLPCHACCCCCWAHLACCCLLASACVRPHATWSCAVPLHSSLCTCSAAGDCRLLVVATLQHTQSPAGDWLQLPRPPCTVSLKLRHQLLLLSQAPYTLLLHTPTITNTGGSTLTGGRAHTHICRKALPAYRSGHAWIRVAAPIFSPASSAAHSTCRQLHTYAWAGAQGAHPPLHTRPRPAACAAAAEQKTRR
jgi:hypothetical protein